MVKGGLTGFYQGIYMSAHVIAGGGGLQQVWASDLQAFETLGSLKHFVVVATHVHTICCCYS